MNANIRDNKSKSTVWGQTTVPIMVVVSAIAIWCSSLSVAAFDVHGTVSGLNSTVSDIKDTLDKADLLTIKAEVNWLAEQRGYKPEVAVIASTTLQ